MKFKRIAALIAVLLFAVAAFAGCAEKETEIINVYTLKGPTGMGMAKLIADNEAGTARNRYKITLVATPDEVKTAVISGEADIAALPVNLAAMLYTKAGADIKLSAVNTLGVLYILDATGEIKTVEDLRGKTIGATGQGATPEYILRALLSKNGIDPDADVQIEYYTEHAELASKIAAGTVKIAMIPEPNATAVLASNSAVVRALDLTAEWDKVSNASLVQGCIVAGGDFLKNRAEEYSNFLLDYGESVEYTKSSPAEAAKLIAAAEILPSEAIALKALPNCNIVFVTGDEAEAAMGAMLEMLYAAQPASIGGALPNEGFWNR